MDRVDVAVVTFDDGVPVPLLFRLLMWPASVGHEMVVYQKKKTAASTSWVTYHGLSIAVLSTEGHVQLELLTISDMSVTCFTSAQSVDSSVKWFARFYVYSDSGVGTLKGDIVADAVRVARRVRYCVCFRRISDRNCRCDH